MSQHRRTVAKDRCRACGGPLALAEAKWCDACQQRYEQERAELESRVEQKE